MLKSRVAGNSKLNRNGKHSSARSTRPLPARRVKDPRTELRITAKRGGVTLVVGAGVSIPRGLPNWEYLARALWKEAFGDKSTPWDGEGSSRGLSQLLPIIFELVYRELGETEFIESLTRHLYARVRYPGADPDFPQSSESLAVIARLLFEEYHREGGRRINAVITLNADDLIEQAINTLAGPKTRKKPFEEPIVFSIARATHFDPGRHVRRPIPVYHIHGFIPSEQSGHLQRFDHMFVFTDTQYWSTSASALTFANRVVASALGEGRCIFIGLSMTDINLLRWLALRTIERDRDYAEIVKLPKLSSPRLGVLKQQFERHFWIRPASDDPGGFLRRFLRERGISSVEIESWTGDHFRQLIEECFGSSASVQKSATTTRAHRQK